MLGGGERLRIHLWSYLIGIPFGFRRSRRPTELFMELRYTDDDYSVHARDLCEKRGLLLHHGKLKSSEKIESGGYRRREGRSRSLSKKETERKNVRMKNLPGDRIIYGTKEGGVLHILGGGRRVMGALALFSPWCSRLYSGCFSQNLRRTNASLFVTPSWFA